MTLDLTPGAPEWCARVTASKVAGILGLSPWDSPLRTWHVMAGNLPSDDGNNADARPAATALRPGAPPVARPEAEPIHHRNTGHVHPRGLGRPPPPRTRTPTTATTSYSWTRGRGDDHWTDTEPPACYVASSLWQLACCPDANRVHLAVLFGRPRLSFRECVIEA